MSTKMLQNYHEDRHRAQWEHRMGTLDLCWGKPCMTEELTLRKRAVHFEDDDDDGS